MIFRLISTVTILFSIVIGYRSRALGAGGLTTLPAMSKEDPWQGQINLFSFNRAMAENPPPAYEKALLNLLASINIGPGLDVEALDEDSKRGLARAAKDGLIMMVMAKRGQVGGEMVNGWRRPPDNTGKLGENGDYLTRGVIQSFKGISSNLPIESRNFSKKRDNNGNYMEGSKKYRLTFPAEKLPPVDAFWSLTMYDLNTWRYVTNPINRFSIGDRTAGMKKNEDGSLTLYVQRESPGKEWENNWLPAAKGRFSVTLRLYRPQAEVLSKEWEPPPLLEVE